jgi:flagellar basal body rod protein FlgG
VARNLAHVNVPGFRRTELVYETFENSNQGRFGIRSNLGTAVRPPHTDFTPGGIQKTGRPLDLAIQGDGFFEIMAPGGPVYTRNGVFQLNADGELANGEGLAVSGGNAPIVIPPGASPSQISVGRDGSVFVDGVHVGKLLIVRFLDNQRLIPAGTTTFRAPPGMPPETIDEGFSIDQGAREMANVSAVDELVRLLIGLRYTEASQRALKTIADSLAKRTERQ